MNEFENNFNENSEGTQNAGTDFNIEYNDAPKQETQNLTILFII